MCHTLVDSLISWLLDWLTGWSMDLVVGCLIDGLLGCFNDLPLIQACLLAQVCYSTSKAWQSDIIR